MKASRYHIFTKNNGEITPVHEVDAWHEALALAQRYIAKDTPCWVFDSEATDGQVDVFTFDVAGGIQPTGHCASPALRAVQLTPIARLSFAALVPSLSLDNCTVLIEPLLPASLHASTDEWIEEEFVAFSALAQTASEGAVLQPPLHRHMADENDIALKVYHQGALIAVATFSRYLEDHRFPAKSSELYYEIALHSVYVKADYRGLGLATALSTLIVNIARKDSEQVYRHVSALGINVKLWFSALAITEGGEAICDVLSEAFVEMADDLIDELLDEGYAVRYQEPMIFVDSLF
ncbi:hypothetical protein JCM19237_2804 [Photobacterium aphoticum]|uniref:N-acetyltransferase domain-containing protein n=1 Tax=Photobacterium aphoticum TaxID=754436 RepID=A0A090RGM1_9GAMM|nr:hypothetical protein JCM19237_2804 [Photobacterium aphoticum]